MAYKKSIKFSIAFISYGFFIGLIEKSEKFGFSIKEAGLMIDPIHFTNKTVNISGYLKQKLESYELYKLYSRIKSKIITVIKFNVWVLV